MKLSMSSQKYVTKYVAVCVNLSAALSHSMSDV